MHVYQQHFQMMHSFRDVLNLVWTTMAKHTMLGVVVQLHSNIAIGTNDKGNIVLVGMYSNM